MWDWLCGPHTCFMAGWLYDFQGLVTGLLATFAAVATVIVVRRQIRASSQDNSLQIIANRENLERQILAEVEARKAEAQDRLAELESARKAVSLAIADEYEFRVSELIRIVGEIDEEAKQAVKSEDDPAIEKKLIYFRRTTQSIVRDSIARARTFILNAQSQIDRLQIADILKHRRSFVELEKALIQMELVFAVLGTDEDKAKSIFASITIDMAELSEMLTRARALNRHASGISAPADDAAPAPAR